MLFAVKPPLHNVMSEGIDADGGFLVPEEFEAQIVTGLEETNVIRTIAKVIKTSAERKIPHRGDPLHRTVDSRKFYLH